MIEDLLREKKILIIGHYSSRYAEFLKQLDRTSNVYFLSVTFTTAFRKKMLRLNKLFFKTDLSPVSKKKLKYRILKIIQKIKPDIIIVPSSDYLIEILSEIKHPSNTVRKINSKLLSKKFQENFKSKLNIPSINKTKNIKLPVVIKPAYGSGSKNVFLIKTKKELKKTLNYFKNEKIEFVIQKFIPKDYFVIYNLFILNKKITGFIYYNDDSKEKTIRKFFLKNILPFLKKTKIQGFISFQCRIANNKVYTLEINPRIHHLTPDAYDFFTRMNANRYLIRRKYIEIKKVKMKENILINYIEKFFLIYYFKSLTEDLNLVSFIVNIYSTLWKLLYIRFILPKKHF